MLALTSPARAGAHIPHRFYGDSSNQADYYWQGHQYDHVQAWVNSLPPPHQPQQQPLPSQQAQRPSAAASSTSAAVNSTDWAGQMCQIPTGLEYTQERSQTERNRHSRHTGSSNARGGREPAERSSVLNDGPRDSNSLQLMKANYCSLSSDASILSSVEDILNERKGNPEELLQILGFGSCKASLAARLPARFLSYPSQARGICTETIVSSHPELVALKEPPMQVLSAELLGKLPEYYHREMPTGDEFDSFSSLHRHFSAKIIGAGEVGSLPRRDSIGYRPSVGGCGYRGAHGVPPPAFTADQSGTIATSGKRNVADEASFRQGFVHSIATSYDQNHVARRPHDTGVAVSQHNSLTASLSSLSDSVFISSSDGVDESENGFDADAWPSHANISEWGSQARRHSSFSENYSENGSGLRKAAGSGGSSSGGKRGLGQKHHSLDLQESGNGRTVTGGLRVTLPVTVLVTSEDDPAGHEGCSPTLPARAGGHLLPASKRMQAAATSPTCLSVVDSFESCESDTQTITGDALDECGFSAACATGTAASDEDGTASSSRLLLAVVPAMESFEMEEVQSINGGPLRRNAPMNRSHSAQSDSSGFADIEDERQQSPPAAVTMIEGLATSSETAVQVPAEDSEPKGSMDAPVLSPSLTNMANVVEALLSAKKRPVLSREPCLAEALSPSNGVATSSPPVALSPGCPGHDITACVPVTSPEHLNTCAQALPEQAEHGSYFSIDEPAEQMHGTEALPESKAVTVDARANSRHEDDGREERACRVTSIRGGGPLTQHSSREAAIGTQAACPSTMHGAPLVRQCAVDLITTLPLADCSPPRTAFVAGSVVRVEEACAELTVSASRTPERPEPYCDAPRTANTGCRMQGAGSCSPAAESFSSLQSGNCQSCRVLRSCCCSPGPAGLAQIRRAGCRSELSDKCRSTSAADYASSVLLALVKPPFESATVTGDDTRLVHRAVQKYRATAYETDAALEMRMQSLPAEVRADLGDEWQSLENVRRSLTREALTLEANILERLESRPAAKPPSVSDSPCEATLYGVSHLSVPHASTASSSSSSSRHSSGIVDECTKLLKEQIYQQKLLESKGSPTSATNGSAGCGVSSEVARLQHQLSLLETKQKYEQRIADLEVAALKMMLHAKDEEIKRLKSLGDID